MKEACRRHRRELPEGAGEAGPPRCLARLFLGGQPTSLAGQREESRRILSFLSSLFVFHPEILLVEHERSEPFGIQ